MEKVTILVPTYFGGQMIVNCITSILESIPNAKFMVFKNDIGWLRACNAMIQSLDTDVILLNDDTLVVSDIVTAMTNLAYSDPKIGIVGGKALAPNMEVIINYGIYIAPDGNSAHKYLGEQRDSVEVIEQKAVEGSCFYIKRELINQIGIFDEDFTMGYRAEVDYCFRAREAGWKVMSTPDAEFIHFVSQTSGPLGITNDTHDVFMKKWGRKLKLGVV